MAHYLCIKSHITISRWKKWLSNCEIVSSILVGERGSIIGNKTRDNKDEDDLDGNEEGDTVFNSSWLPGSDPK